jgi:hypothetical protein
MGTCFLEGGVEITVRVRLIGLYRGLLSSALRLGYLLRIAICSQRRDAVHFCGLRSIPLDHQWRA